VGTQVSGVISKIYVDYNDIVKAGQVIALLDTRNLQVSLDEAEANLSKAQTQLAQIKGEFDRNQILLDKKLVTQSDYDIQLSNYKSAQNTVQTAEGELSRASINLNLATIVAPISGIIISRNVDVGQTVAASFTTPTLFTIANDLKKMQLQANVDEADISQIKIGQAVFFNVDAYPNETFSGIVQQLQLLLEAVVLSLFGGILGIILGLVISFLVSKFGGFTTIVSIQSIVISFVASTLIGIFFGWYPSRKAANLNPIDALRYE